MCSLYDLVYGWLGVNVTVFDFPSALEHDPPNDSSKDPLEEQAVQDVAKFMLEKGDVMLQRLESRPIRRHSRPPIAE